MERQFRGSHLWVSSDGVVTSYYPGRPPRVVKGSNNRGYAVHTIGGGQRCPAHRMVMECWGSPCPGDGDWTIDHIDEDKRNNSIENLQWLLRGENAARSAYRANQLTPEQRREIIRDYVPFKVTEKMLAERYGVERGPVRHTLDLYRRGINRRGINLPSNSP